MKKIVLACDGRIFPRAAMQSIKHLHAEEPVMVTVLLFSKINYLDMLSVAYAPVALPLLEMTEEEGAMMKKCISEIEDHCQRNGIEYRVHHESASWNPDDIIIETRFADLLMIGEQSFFYNDKDILPNAYIEQLLHRTECPVLLVPDHYTDPSRIVIAYNGKKECVYALKLLVYLFPAWTSLETEIVYMHPDKETIPHLDYLKEYAARHFSNLTFKRLNFTSKNNLSTYANEGKDVLLVSGAYGRSGVSTAMRSSFVRDLIAEHQISLFIAHSL